MLAASNPFAKTRNDHSIETTEDYVEVIMRLAGTDQTVSCELATNVKTVDIAKTVGVAQPTVTKILNRLEIEGLVCIHRRRSVHLTEAGVELARKCLLRHDLIVDFLLRIGVSQEQANLDTEGIEHHLSDETLNAIKAIMISPTPI